MEATDLPPDGREPNTTPPRSPAITRTRGRWIPWSTLALAVFWLIASVIAGIGLIRDDPEAASALTVSPPTLSSSSGHASYGGDAYTGIQNAASDTEHAVVNGVNKLGAFQLALQQAVAAQEARRSSHLQSQVQDGLGLLIIGIGVLNFTVALTRFTRAGRPSDS
jgi:hypothetical protein